MTQKRMMVIRQLRATRGVPASTQNQFIANNLRLLDASERKGKAIN